ncbi:hypothetical protein HY988_02535 [Candidatus Micrarchaeota archaeon]|nr:hypothetical protein [Candidatus Micrarchaeota archaeon]
MTVFNGRKPNYEPEYYLSIPNGMVSFNLKVPGKEVEPTILLVTTSSDGKTILLEGPSLKFSAYHSRTSSEITLKQGEWDTFILPTGRPLTPETFYDGLTFGYRVQFNDIVHRLEPKDPGFVRCAVVEITENITNNRHLVRTVERIPTDVAISLSPRPLTVKLHWGNMVEVLTNFNDGSSVYLDSPGATKNYHFYNEDGYTKGPVLFSARFIGMEYLPVFNLPDGQLIGPGSVELLTP